MMIVGSFIRSIRINLGPAVSEYLDPLNVLDVVIHKGLELAATSHKNDTRLLASKIKHYKLLFNYLYVDTVENIDDRSRKAMEHVLKDLEAIYPINKDKYASIWELYSSFKGRGIVMAAGNEYFR
jgi:histidyl-tRNA synthetase